MNESLAILNKMLQEVERGSIREITFVEFEIAAEIPLRVSYMDKGGNYHAIGFTNEHKLVTFE
jgi:hypothetical protein